MSALRDPLVQRHQVALLLIEEAADRDLVEELADFTQVLALRRRDDAFDNAERLGRTASPQISTESKSWAREARTSRRAG